MTQLPNALNIDGVTYDVEMTMIGKGIIVFEVAEKRNGLFSLIVPLDKITELVNSAAMKLDKVQP